MTVATALDAAGRRRSPATMPGYHAGRPPRNKGMQYPADPPTVDEIVAVMRHTGEDRQGSRLRAMIVVLWRAGLRIHEALALAEHDLDPRRGSVLVRTGLRAVLDRACASAGFEPRIAFEASDPYVLAQLAARGLGVAIVPESLAAAHPDEVQALRLRRPALRGRLALAWRASGPPSPAARAFVEHARATLAGGANRA
jgi:DNA-binding transcriptional LysR family regulator